MSSSKTPDAATLLRQAVDHHMRGRLADALALYDTVIRSNPNLAAVHCNRGIVLQTLGRFDDAVRSYDRAIALEPRYADAYYNKATVLRHVNRPDDAVRNYDLAIEFKPDHVEAHTNKGVALRDLGRPEEALHSFDRAIALRPGVAIIHYQKGNALQDLGRLDEAVRSFDEAIAQQAHFPEAHYNRAIALQSLKRLKEAVASYDCALACKPDFAEALYNKANTLRELKRPDDAIEAYDRAIALRPGFAAAHFNRANTLRDLGLLPEALQGYDRTIESDSAHAGAYCNKGVCLLTMGRFDEGWPLYEWRKQKFEPSQRRSFPQPAWSGKEDLRGKTLFVYAEQGLGDTIQFCRYAPLARQMGAKVILAVQGPLIRLLGSLDPEIVIIALEAPPPEFNFHIALPSMPQAFHTDADNCPAAIPYLRAEPDRVARWKGRLGENGFKIGICWQGNRNAEIDAGRSFPLRLFESLARIPGVRLISLQKNDGAEQLHNLPAGMAVETLGEDFDAGPDAFVDTAAVMENLDLVITSDTAIAHLAGALARPVWVALKFVPDWRWLLGRTDSPWYPTMQLFRQWRRDDWAGVFAAMETQVRALVAARPS